ncbi:MAG: hypothetical protein RL558_922, partial [Bacteroidota bacterium]
PNMEGLELCSTVSTKEPYTVGKADAEFNVATLDLGIKRSILRNLLRVGCRVTVYPYNTPFAVLSADEPDGYFLSNGPGDPAASSEVIDTVREILASNKPTFGICLGHQMIALASGLSTYKMHNGHRGINHVTVESTIRLRILERARERLLHKTTDLPSPLRMWLRTQESSLPTCI